MLGTTGIQIHRQPIFHFSSIERGTPSFGTGVPQEIPGRTHKSIQRVRLPFSRAATGRAGGIHELLIIFQRRFAGGLEFGIFRQLNRQVFLDRPLSLLPVAVIATASTFLLGWAIKGIGRVFRIQPGTVTSLILLGTIKNYGLAGGLSLALFSSDTAVPATVSTIFMTVYIIWLGFQMKGQNT